MKVPYIYFKDSGPGKSTNINGACLKNLSDKGCLPASVGGLHAPTNCILSNLMNYLSDPLQKPFYSVIYLKKAITIYVPYLSSSGRFISSQNTTNHLSNYLGLRTIPYGVFLYSQ